jgi:hypothetical protein
MRPSEVVGLKAGLQIGIVRVTLSFFKAVKALGWNVA